MNLLIFMSLPIILWEIFDKLGSFKAIHELLEKQDKLLVFLTKAEHKIKKKAEQIASEISISTFVKVPQNRTFAVEQVQKCRKTFTPNRTFAMEQVQKYNLILFFLQYLLFFFHL